MQRRPKGEIIVTGRRRGRYAYRDSEWVAICIVVISSRTLSVPFCTITGYIFWKRCCAVVVELVYFVVEIIYMLVRL